MNRWIDANGYWGRWSVRTSGVDNLETFIAKMDSWSVGVTALTSILSMVDNTQRGNRETAAVVRKAPDRFVGVACVNPMLGEAAYDEISRCVDEDFRAIRLYPAHHLYTAHDRAVLDPFLERVAATSLPVYWTGCPVSGTFLKQTSLDGLLPLVKAHPEVPFILSAYNYGSYYPIQWLMREANNVFLEMSFYHGVEGVREFTQGFGAERVLLGTGYGIQYAGIGVGMVATADISEEARAAVGRENAQRLLRIALSETTKDNR